MIIVDTTWLKIVNLINFNLLSAELETDNFKHGNFFLLNIKLNYQTTPNYQIGSIY